MLIRGSGGWVFFDELETGGDLYTRLVDGRIVEIYLTKNGEEVTPADLRRLPLSRVRAQALSRPDLLRAGELKPDPPDVNATVRTAFPETWIKAKPQKRPPVTLRPDSPEGGLTDTFLRDVAAAYRDAVGRGLRPNKALAEQTQSARRTVEKWVYLARKKGLLEPTRPGSVG